MELSGTYQSFSCQCLIPWLINNIQNRKDSCQLLFSTGTHSIFTGKSTYYYYYYCYCSCQYQIGEDIPLCAWFKAVLRRLSQQGLFSTGPRCELAVEALPAQVSNSKLTHANVLILKMYSRQDNLAHDKLDKSQGNWCCSLIS